MVVGSSFYWCLQGWDCSFPFPFDSYRKIGWNLVGWNLVALGSFLEEVRNRFRFHPCSSCLAQLVSCLSSWMYCNRFSDWQSCERPCMVLRQTVQASLGFVCIRSRQVWNFIWILVKLLLIGKSGNCVNDSLFFAGIYGAAYDSSISFKCFLDFVFSSVSSQAPNEGHKVFFWCKRSEDKGSGGLNFKIGVEVLQGSFTGLNAGVCDDSFTGLSVESLDSDFFSQFTEFSEFVLNDKIKVIRKDLFKVWGHQVFGCWG